MRLRFVLVILIGITYFNWSDNCKAQEKPVSPLRVEPIREGLKNKVEEGVTLPVTELHIYWKEGLHIDGRYENLKVKIGGSLMVDGGSIHTDNELKKTFSDFEGWGGDFRRLRVNILSTFYDVVDLKLDVDFANIREIKDNWITLKKKMPILGYIKFGHMKEPFSLEGLTSGTNITFMERSLPTLGFSPGRNLGILFHNALLDDRMTWAVGGFWNTGSLSKVGEATDRVSDADGYNLTARVTGLPWYEEGGKKLLHLGLSYSHGVRQKDQGEVRFRAKPESFLKDDRLVDTGALYMNSLDLINPELAMVLGPFSLQGEYFHAFTGASNAGNPQFWGFYLQANYFLTGEHRTYNTATAVFSQIKPKQDFHPFGDGWGAWEVAARLSYLDLNDGGDVKGGQETNLTLGLNWYLNPNLRLMFNYIRAHVEDRRTSRPIDNGYANIVQARFQFAF
jgi:phosphate-selective porin OprO/OprP